MEILNRVWVKERLNVQNSRNVLVSKSEGPALRDAKAILLLPLTFDDVATKEGVQW